MESVLRPRDIQARIRAGESPEAVAGLAQVTVDKIMPYCFPVLAERQHIAQLARRSHVRRKGVDGPARSLDAVVSDRLHARTIDPEAADWDAWRRDDGRWTVQVSYHSGERQRAATFAFDSVGRYSLADDDEAKWLTGERQSTSKGPQPREPGRAGDRRLSAVPDTNDLLSLSGDAATALAAASVQSDDGLRADGLVGDELTDEELTDDLTAVVRAIQDPAPEQEAEPRLEGEFEAGGVVETELEPDLAADRDAALDTDLEPQEPPETVEAEPARAARIIPVSPPGDAATEPVPDRRRRAQRRASVPSWDEIMFGANKDE